MVNRKLISLLLLLGAEHEVPFLPRVAPLAALTTLLNPALMQHGDHRALVGVLSLARELRLQHAQPRLHVAAVDRAHLDRLIGEAQVDAEVVIVHALRALDPLD